VSASGDPRTIEIPVPLLAPFMIPLDSHAVQNVWDAFVKPDQDAGMPQSIEMRALMAILRAVYAGMTGFIVAEVEEVEST
jgi:hypothetical protein